MFGFCYAATRKRQAKNFACPAQSLPPDIFTCPFLRVECLDAFFCTFSYVERAEALHRPRPPPEGLKKRVNAR